MYTYASFQILVSNFILCIQLRYNLHYTGCIKKVDKSEIALCFAKRLNIPWFFIKIDCFGTYNLE